jgi:hypothetical protein
VDRRGKAARKISNKKPSTYIKLFLSKLHRATEYVDTGAVQLARASFFGKKLPIGRDER